MPLNQAIQVASNAQELSRLAAELFVPLAVEAVREKGLFTVALAGGSTPRTLYSLLASRHEPFRAQVPWDRIYFFWGDERHVPPDHPESNYLMACEAMLSNVPVPPDNIHRIKSENAVAARAAHDYERTFREIFRLAEEGQLPRLDLILLGMGTGRTHGFNLSRQSCDQREESTCRCSVGREVAELAYHTDSSRAEQRGSRDFSCRWPRKGKGAARGSRR